MPNQTIRPDATLSKDVILLQDLEHKCNWLITSIEYFEEQDMSFTARQLRSSLALVRAKLRDHRAKMLEDVEIKDTA